MSKWVMGLFLKPHLMGWIITWINYVQDLERKILKKKGKMGSQFIETQSTFATLFSLHYLDCLEFKEVVMRLSSLF